jgi:hypothetical protein
MQTAGNGHAQELLQLRQPFVCLLGQDTWRFVDGLRMPWRLPCLGIPQPLRLERLFEFRGHRNESATPDPGDKIHVPSPGADPRGTLPARVNGDRACVAATRPVYDCSDESEGRLKRAIRNR